MKNKTQDKAAARLWRVDAEGVSTNGRILIHDEQERFSVYCLHGDFMNRSTITKEDAIKRANKIVQAVNEHAALCAVAEAWAKFKKFYFEDLGKNNEGFIGKLRLNDYGAMNDAYLSVAKADANLAAVRKGAK